MHTCILIETQGTRQILGIHTQPHLPFAAPEEPKKPADEKKPGDEKKKPAEAARFLTGFCLNNAKTVVDAWWKLGDDLLVKYNRLYLYNVEKRGIHSILAETAVGMVAGFGVNSYLLGLDALLGQLKTARKRKRAGG